MRIDDDAMLVGTPLVRRAFASGSLLFSPGDAAEHCYLVISGSVRVYAVSPEGREVTFWYCGPGEFIGMAEIDGAPRRCYASAREASAVFQIPLGEMDRLLERRPQLGRAMLVQMGRRLQLARDAMLALVASRASARLAHLLLRLPTSPSPISVHPRLKERYTHLELANMTGLSRQTVSEILSEFRRRGLIDVDQRHILLLQPSKLAALT